MIIGSLEDIVTRLDMRVNTLELRLKLMDHQPELQPEPPPDLEATIKSLYDTIEGLKNQLYDAKQTERDLDAEIVALQKENHRLTRLAWQAEQDKRGAEAIAKAAAEELERIKQHNDDLARDAGSLIGARALNEALTQKQHMLEAKNHELADSLAHERAERDLVLEQLDAARRGHADMKNRLDATMGAHRALVRHVVEQRRGLLSILGAKPPANDRCDND